MSDHGLFANYLSSEHRLSGDWLVRDDKDEEGSTIGEVEGGERGGGGGPGGPGGDDDDLDESMPREEGLIQASPRDLRPMCVSQASQTNPDEQIESERPKKRPRISFYDFAAQARLQQHHERRKKRLAERKRILQRSVALAARLRRASSWVQDGLVEISKHQDKAGFVRVFSHANDLVDTCYSHWNNELQKLDILQSPSSESSQPSTTPAFFHQLQPTAQRDLLNLLSDLRSNPRFLIDRLSNLPTSQVATLTAKPRWEASEALLTSLSQQSGGSTQRRRRIQEFSKQLEDYATSFERTDPLAFLLHNIYSNDASPESRESQLRLWTWSTVCAQLLKSQSESYGKLYWQALEAFSAMQGWPAKQRIELFLMDILQRGAFLINDTTSQRAKLGSDPLNTQQAHDFFESAVSDLYWTLIKCNSGCYPTGALSLAQAILGKLPNEAHQSDFRVHFFQKWFLNHFLKTAIIYPENENMLLKIHVSKRAREYILAPLFHRFVAKFENSMDPDTEVNENIQNIILGMINMLDGKDTSNPYADAAIGDHDPSLDTAGTSVVVICASECAKILETLTPQAIYSSHYMSEHIESMRWVGEAFQVERSAAPNTKFDLLKQALLQLIEPGTSAKDTHPCLEAWTEFRIDASGRVIPPDRLPANCCLESLKNDNTLEISQRAAVRLCTENNSHDDGNHAPPILMWTPTTRLTKLFQIQMEQSQAATHMVDFIFWKKSLSSLHDKYPLMMASADSFVLAKPLERIRSSKLADVTSCEALEAQLGPFERLFRDFKVHIKEFVASLEGLRLKLWYTSEVVNSRRYADARNVALALSHMNILHLRMTSNADASSKSFVRPSSSRSGAASIFGSRRDEAMEILKAPTEYGGPRKLADAQIETIKQWLDQNNIDNFCTGEERLHRFCMEIWQVSRMLTGETMLESEELWASELFMRERTSYDIAYYGINSAPASTRPASIISDSLSASATFPALRSGSRSMDSDVRSTMSDERSSIRRGSVYGLFERRLNPDFLNPSLASSMASYGRASSATTTASDIFSQPSQSVTSASVYSRPPSILQASFPNFASRPAASIRDKKKFRDKLRMGLVCLLLSDLGSLVWSWGCETDTWIQGVQATSAVMIRLEKRLSAEALRNDNNPRPARPVRRQSTGIRGADAVPQRQNSPPTQGETQEETQGRDEDDYVTALRDTLVRMSQHVDPLSKLQTCLDFAALALEQLESIDGSNKANKIIPSPEASHAERRKSFDQYLRGSAVDDGTGLARLSLTGSDEVTERRVLQHFRRQLARIRPETIFRDLQYIAVFTPPEMLEKTPAGKEFMRLGVAAIEYKKELCGSMVDIADQIVAADSIKRVRAIGKPEPSLHRAAEYWKLAALEGNREAQRELALLYLMHPEILPVVTLPLCPSTSIFKDDMMWQKKVGSNTSRQALCLALHWMQQAAKKGDTVARKKLEEREGGLSIP